MFIAVCFHLLSAPILQLIIMVQILKIKYLYFVVKLFLILMLYVKTEVNNISVFDHIPFLQDGITFL